MLREHRRIFKKYVLLRLVRGGGLFYGRFCGAIIVKLKMRKDLTVL